MDGPLPVQESSKRLELGGTSQEFIGNRSSVTYAFEISADPSCSISHIQRQAVRVPVACLWPGQTARDPQSVGGGGGVWVFTSDALGHRLIHGQVVEDWDEKAKCADSIHGLHVALHPNSATERSQVSRMRLQYTIVSQRMNFSVTRLHVPLSRCNVDLVL